MKRFLLFILGVIFANISLFSQTYGHLNVSVSTSDAGGNYAPRNIVAIWVEDDSGNFVKTLMAYAQNRRTHLNNWQASTSQAGTEYNAVDAVIGATRNSHATRDCLWNGLDYNQNLMPDGNYLLWMELTDKNNTGNYSSFEFAKGEDMQELLPTDVPGFSNISIVWEPSGTGVLEYDDQNNYNINNNPGNGLFEVSGHQFDKIDVYSISGQYIHSFDQKLIDISDQKNGIYLLKIQDSDDLRIIKVLKR